MPEIKDLHEWTGFLVDVVVILGAIVAIVKLQLFNMLGFRWRADLECTHHDLPKGDVIFTVDYTITNTGERPLQLKSATISLYASRTDENHLVAIDKEKLLVTRTLDENNPSLKGLFDIEPGERSIFPLRAQLDSLGEATFVLCEFTLKQKRTPAHYLGFYVKSAKATKKRKTANDVKRKIT